MREPTPQDLPRCYRHPQWPCPGECQYQLGPDECINDRAPPEPGIADLMRAKNAEIEAQWRAGKITDRGFDWWLRTMCGA